MAFLAFFSFDFFKRNKKHTIKLRLPQNYIKTKRYTRLRFECMRNSEKQKKPKNKRGQEKQKTKQKQNKKTLNKQTQNKIKRKKEREKPSQPNPFF